MRRHHDEQVVRQIIIIEPLDNFFLGIDGADDEFVILFDVTLLALCVHPYHRVVRLAGGFGFTREILDLDAVANAAVQDVRAAVVKRQANPGQLPALPSFMANPLQLFLSLANLRGVPYLMTMQTEGGVRGHRMVAHMDYGHFAIFGVSGGPSEPLPGGSTSVNPQRGSQSASQDGWDDLMAAALSTSAFPVGLRSRKFQNDLSVYQLKLFSRTFGDDPDTPPLTIAPDLLEREARPYSFWTCDGGLLNNEPLEYARVALSGAPDEKNPRDAKDANRAVLMIDPFPDDTGAAVPEEKDLGDVMSLIFSLLPALKAQARFKPQELACALNESIYSRFLIAPVRQGKKPGETEIASFGLSGFAGFFEQSFRRHDFQLGRRNCQKFLRDHLAVHVENPVVRNWVARLKQAGSLDKFHTRTRDALGNDKLDENFVQLIPLMDSVLTPIDALEWPRLSGGVNALLAKLSPDLKLRIEAVLDRAVPSLMKLMGIKDKGIFGGLVKWLAEQKLRRVILDLAIDSISKDLKARGLG